MMSEKTRILTAENVEQKVNRLAWQLFENNVDQKEVVIVGISGRGQVFASKLSQSLERISSIKTLNGTITLDKDNPYDNEITIDLLEKEYSGKVVVLADDVLSSGKTLMYAAKHFLTTPLIKLSTVVLIDRNHNRFPIKADYVGLSLATTLQEYINVVLEGKGQGVYLS